MSPFCRSPLPQVGEVIYGWLFTYILHSILLEVKGLLNRCQQIKYVLYDVPSNLKKPYFSQSYF